MLKAVIKKEIEITNKEIAHYLYNDGAFLDYINEIIDGMLYRKYRMDYMSRSDAIAELKAEDYAEILKALGDELSANASS